MPKTKPQIAKKVDTGKTKLNEARYELALEIALVILLGNETLGSVVIGYSNAVMK